MTGIRGIRIGFAVLVGTVLLAPPVSGQVEPKPDQPVQVPDAAAAARVPPGGYSVLVGPDDGTATAAQGTQTVLDFYVVNTGESADTYTFTCTPFGSVECVSVSPSSAFLRAGWEMDVEVTINVNSGGTVRMRATGNATDYGLYSVTTESAGPSQVTLHNHNADFVNRSQCVTTGAGEAAAVQCGDLLVAHAMPAYRTMSRDRSVTLVYSSATAEPRPAVAAWVTIPSGLSVPSSVYAELKVDGVKRANATYSTSGWSAGQTRQIVLAFDASSYSTGVYPFTLMVRSQYGSGPEDTSVNGKLIVVNREASRFGAGWWVAGVEQLVTNTPDGSLLWVGADGSARVYEVLTSSSWRAAAGAFRDTIYWNSSLQEYERHLRDNVTVVYNSAGRHVRTVNRLGHVTTFIWVSDRLDRINIPTAGTPTSDPEDPDYIPGTPNAFRYSFSYDANGKLDWVFDPTNRFLGATVTSGNLTNLIDTDQQSTSFGYDSQGRMESRTNRRGYTSYFRYYNDLRVRQIETPRETQSSMAYTVITHWDERGLAVGEVGSRTPALTSDVYTQVDGPRTDVSDIAKFWVDRWGAPTQIRDPLGHETSIERDAGTGLVTRMEYPNGRIVTAVYNDRGNLDSVVDHTHQGTGTTRTARTKYVYNSSAAPDSPTQVVTPENEVTTVEYNGDGLPSALVAPGGHRTEFEYSSANLPWKTIEYDVLVVDTLDWDKGPATLTTRVEYDAWGNDTLVISPEGRRTRYQRDEYGRVVSVHDPANHRTDYEYSLVNQVETVTVYDPGTLVTTYDYTAGGQLERVTDPRGVTRAWGYDAGGRLDWMQDEAGASEDYNYGPSGLLDYVITRTGHVIRHHYDAAGRHTSTVFPAFSNTFPGFSEENATIPGDSIYREYDEVGRVVVAGHAKGEVTRSYFREGALATERQVVRDDGGAIKVDVTMQYLYDLNGRRTTFTNGSDTLQYSYGNDGRLASLAVRWGLGTLPTDTFNYTWDGLGRRGSLVYERPNVTVNYGFDADGRQRLVCSHHPGATGSQFEARLWHRTVTADGLTTFLEGTRAGEHSSGCNSAPWNSDPIEFAHYTYDQRHQMLSDDEEWHAYDGSGNRVSVHNVSGIVDSLQYNAQSNRLSAVSLGTPIRFATLQYHANGNTRMRVPADQQYGHVILYYYDALGRLRGSRKRIRPNEFQFYWMGTRDACEYDAMGRRVRTCDAAGWLAFDGENAVRMHGAQGVRWRYVHGPGTDDPLAGAFLEQTTHWVKYYYLTDGNSRHLAFADTAGFDMMYAGRWSTDGGNLAGSIASSFGFGNSRAEVDGAPDLSFYRNRYYDRQTGRFLTEDPIGIAGGINLYQYAGNNPAAYTDPFGLCPKDVGGDGSTDSVDDCPKEVKLAWARKHIVNTSSNDTDIAGVDTRLMDAVVRTSMDWRSSVGISAGKEGGHSIEGRHAEGGALDINMIGGVRFSDMSDTRASSVGNAFGRGIAGRLPAGSVKMLFTPGMATRSDRTITRSSKAALIGLHRSHIHITIWP